MRYDYTAFFMATDTAKPAYDTFRQLIHKLGAWTKATGRPSPRSVSSVRPALSSGRDVAVSPQAH
jgi:hypothetical protein